ncbi:MAG: hypothetical protein A2Z16_16550 [Chloroflexi bacterium RBG_16_54_18]|nr:MAG: hypothetical protein A2Z16_16550 [Chloroflexi bacterium RBG_16_54_18]
MLIKSVIMPVKLVVILSFTLNLVFSLHPPTVQASPSACTTIIANHIITETIWSAAGSPYCLAMTEMVQIAVNKTLTIQPGVTVFVQDLNGGLIVNGTIDSFGTQLEPVLITSDEVIPQPGDWDGIKIPAGGQAQLEYTYIGYAGSNVDEAILVESGLFELNNSRIHHTEGRGLRFSGSFGLTATVTDNLFDYNTWEAILEEPGAHYDQAPLYSGNTLENNGQDVLTLSSAPLAFNRTLDSKGALNSSPFLLLGNGIEVNSGKTLTVAPGTTIQFAETWGSLLVSGSLIAEGLPVARILFTTDEPTPVPGDWGRITIPNSGQASLAYCDLAFGGGDNNEALRIDSAFVQIHACRIHHTLGTGMTITASPMSQLVNNAVTHSTGSGLRLSGAELDALHTTLAHNAIGLILESSSSANLANTVITGHTLGVSVEAGSLATLDRTLWDSNTTNSSGTVIEVNPIQSYPAALDADGFHLTYSSMAVDIGISHGLTSDIDGDPRPIAAYPDIGADEYYDALGVFDNISGGSLDYDNAQGFPTSVQVPVGAVSLPTTLVIKRSESPAMPVPPPNPAFFSAGHTFDLEAFQNNIKLPGFTFNIYLSVIIDYSDADITGLDESQLKLFYWTGSEWKEASCGAYTRDLVQNRIWVPVCHTSRFMLAEPEYWDYLPLVSR